MGDPLVDKVGNDLSRISYANPAPYKVYSAERALGSGVANCMEFALVAAYCMEPLGFPPRMLEMFGSHGDKPYGHAVYPFGLGWAFGSFGLSLYPDLCGRPMVYPGMDGLIQSYWQAFDRHGITPAKSFLYDLDKTGIDWRHSPDDLSDAFLSFRDANVDKMSSAGLGRKLFGMFRWFF